MIKYVFCDHDDVLVSSSPKINIYVDQIAEHSSFKLKARERAIALAESDLIKTVKESNRALEAKEVPCYDTPFTTNNDVIKEFDTKELDALYLEPIRIAEENLKDAKWAKEMFMEGRDCFLERDNKLSNGKVDYHYIHRFDPNGVDDNVNHMAVDTLNRVVDEGLFDGVFELSHHNGGREVDAKLEFNKAAFGNKIPFMGQRFHDSEHVEGQRRGRSCKVNSIRGKFDISESVLIDDSLANVKMWTNEGGPCIWYKPLSTEEKISGVMKPLDSSINGAVRLTVFDYDHLMEAINELNNRKVLVK